MQTYFFAVRPVFQMLRDEVDQTSRGHTFLALIKMAVEIYSHYSIDNNKRMDRLTSEMIYFI